MDMKNVMKFLAQAKSLELREMKKEKKDISGDEISVTHHIININDKPMKYKATAGYLKMKDEHHKLKTKMFFISYEKEDVRDIAKRPITFAFNGGPGAASAWVHFGAMGPKRVVTSEEGEINPPPYKFEDNVETWLQFTDLVFMDPVGTGYSLHEKDEDPKQFYGVEEDIKSGGDFIRQYITREKRWLSPKYLAGESYGTFRSVGLVSYMQRQHALDFNGIVLISSVLNFKHISFDSGNDLPYLLFLPGYAAAAWYHKKLSPKFQENFEKTLKEVEDWVLNKYSVALVKGDMLSKDEKDCIIREMSQYIGIPQEYIRRSNLRIKINRFLKNLLKDKRQVLGRYDARFTAFDVDPAGDEYKTDPSLFNMFGSCIAALNDYLRRDLKYENELPYAPLSKEVNKNWNWDSGMDDMGYVNIMEKLAEAMSYNKYLKVFFACGYYDLCTPHFISDYTVHHLGITDEQKENITLSYYKGGHMMYVHGESRKKLFKDVKDFVEK